MTNVDSKPTLAGKEFEELIPTLEISPFGEFNSRNLAAAAKANTAILKGAITSWAHCSSFVGRRLRADAELVRELNTSRNGEEAVRAQNRFVSTMITDYVNQMQELLSIGADAARSLIEPIEKRAEEAFHSMEARNEDKEAA